MEDFHLQNPIKDLLIILGLTAALPFVRFILDRTLYEAFAEKVLISAHLQKTGQVPDKIKGKIRKFKESLWKLTAYGTCFSLGLRMLKDEGWVWDPTAFWLEWPNHRISDAVRAYYFAELALYISSCVTLLTWEVPRKDKWVMLTHHFATVTLIALSWFKGFTRCGVMIMLLHDPSDIVLETAKLFSYSSLEGPATFFFAVFVISWLLLRLAYLPFWVITETWAGCMRTRGFNPPHYELLNFLLCLLVAMHIYWFWLILKVAYGKVVTGVARDNREGGDDDDD